MLSHYGVNFEKGLIAVERLKKIVPSNYDLSQHLNGYYNGK